MGLNHCNPKPIMTILIDDAMRILVQALGRGLGNPPNNQNIERGHNPSRNHSIAILKLLAKCLNEGDTVSHSLQPCVLSLL